MRVLAIALLAMVLAACSTTERPQYLATVKVQAGAGHGSATHIGNGYILTAAHVIDGKDEITVKSSINSVHKPEVLWSNKTYDVALLRIRDYAQFDSARLECRTPQPDEPIIARGNPLAFDFTSYRGFISGSRREISRWKSAVPADITIVPGISGGGVYDNRGYLIAIAVGTAAHRMGMMSASLVPIGVLVPGKAICDLMGRA